jgi:hypothetical protein
MRRRDAGTVAVVRLPTAAIECDSRLLALVAVPDSVVQGAMLATMRLLWSVETVSADNPQRHVRSVRSP